MVLKFITEEHMCDIVKREDIFILRSNTGVNDTYCVELSVAAVGCWVD